MNRRSVLALIVIPCAGLLALPTLSSCLVQDFLHQTMRIDGEFEGVSVDPINGKLVLKNLVLSDAHSMGDKSDESATIAQSMNSIGTTWANFSLQQLLYRRFDSSLIVMDGLEIGHCDKSVSMLPDFKPHADMMSTKRLPQISADTSSFILNDPVFQVSIKTALDQARDRAAVEQQHLQSEINRLKRDAKLLSAKPIDTHNPLRSELEAKRIRSELDRITGELKALGATLERNVASTADAGPLARDKILVDWMTWNNTRLAEVDDIDIEHHVRRMLSSYASDCIKPIVPALVTTHAISRWSVGASNAVADGVSDTERRKDFDLILPPKAQPPFTFRNVKLRGRTLVGSEPLTLTGTVKNLGLPKQNAASLVSTQSTQTDLTFTDTTIPPTSSTSTLSIPLVASATYSPTTPNQTIVLKHHDLRMVNQVESPLQLSEEGLRSKIRSAHPKSELTWSLEGDRWECIFKTYGSDIQIDIVASQQLGPSAANKPIPKATEFAGNSENSFNLYRSKSHRQGNGTPFLEITYSGKLDGEKFDNCNETLSAGCIADITQSIKSYLKQRTESELVALKANWIRHAEEQIASWQKSNEAEQTTVRRGIQEFEKEITAQQSRLAEVFASPSEERFARKNLQDKSGNITR
jgi:hypothetical protein